jgi:allantoicase
MHVSPQRFRGAPGNLEAAEIDTANFVGNYPASAELHAVLSEKVNNALHDPRFGHLNISQDIPNAPEEVWSPILTRTKLGPHRRHHFQLQNVEGVRYSHVRLSIYPDGGVKRLRITGKRVSGGPETDSSTTTAPNTTAVPSLMSEDVVPKGLGVLTRVIPALPLTPEAFAPYGDVVQAYTTPIAAPRGVKVTSVNQGSAMKYHALATVKSSYPEDAGARTTLSMFRSQAIDAKPGEEFDVKLLERHPYTNQAFFAVGAAGVSEYALTKQGRAYLVIVALSGEGKC